MKTSRRKFGKLLGVSLVAPAIVPAAGLSYIERAELEVEQTGEVSAELTMALLDAQGARGIFAEPEHFEELRRSLARKIRDHKIIRDFPVPPDVEPILGFRR
jgi:hypothetical protein